MQKQEAWLQGRGAEGALTMRIIRVIRTRGPSTFSSSSCDLHRVLRISITRSSAYFFRRGPACRQAEQQAVSNRRLYRDKALPTARTTIGLADPVCSSDELFDLDAESAHTACPSQGRAAAHRADSSGQTAHARSTRHRQPTTCLRCLRNRPCQVTEVPDSAAAAGKTNILALASR